MEEVSVSSIETTIRETGELKLLSCAFAESGSYPDLSRTLRYGV